MSSDDDPLTIAYKRSMRMTRAEIEAAQQAGALRMLDAAYADEGGYAAHVSKEIDALMAYNDHELTQRTRPVGSPTWSPRAYAALRGLTGTTADMFTEIATAIQNARQSTPW